MNPTQVQHPWRATTRTILAYIVAAGIVLPIAYGIFAEYLGEYIPIDWLAALAWLVGLVVAVSGAVTRIMAIPQVNDWLTRVGVGPAPRPDDEPLPRRAIEADETDGPGN